MEIIGLSGKAGSGKDYIGATYLKPLGFVPFSFAWHFKVWLIGKGEATHEEVFYTKPPHIRKLLQQEGTERGRMVYGDNVWCDTLAEWLLVLEENMGLNRFFIPDIRFPNEVATVKRLGGKLFRIDAPNRVLNNNLTDEARLHPSETSLDDYFGFDAYIYNDYHQEESVPRQMKELLRNY